MANQEEQYRLTPVIPHESQFPEEPEEAEGQYDGRPTQAVITELSTQDELPLSVESIRLAERMGIVQAKLEVELTNLEHAGEAIAKLVNGIKPTDQASYATLCESLEENRKFLNQVEDFIEPWRQLFYRPYQAVLARAKQIVGLPEQSLQQGKGRRLDFERQVRIEAERETARLQAEQRQQEEEQRLVSAVTAEELGMSPAAVETILAAPSTAPTLVAAPQISRPMGVRKIAANWQAELADKAAFWAWAKKQKEMPVGLVLDQVAMNREAKTHKATLAQRFPGWRGVNKGGE